MAQSSALGGNPQTQSHSGEDRNIIGKKEKKGSEVDGTRALSWLWRESGVRCACLLTCSSIGWRLGAVPG